MNKRLLLLLSIPAIALAVLSCNGKGEAGDSNNRPAPVIERVVTTNEGNTAIAGKPVYLMGSNFSPVASENKVLVGIGVDAEALAVIDASETQVVFLAPALTKSTIKVRVSTNGKESNQVDVTYYIPPEAPVVTGIATSYENNTVVPGEPVTLSGQHFSATRAKNKIVYGEGAAAVSLPVTSATETQLVFKAPDVEVSSLKIRVSTNSVESNEVELTYPAAWSDTPTLTLPGATSVTIVPGVEWISFHGVWEGSTRNINIVKTTLDEHNKLGIFFNYRTDAPAGYPPVGDGEDYRDLDKKCIYLDAVAGTNGPMACCQFVRVNGVEQNPPVEADDWIENCAITIDGNGSVVDIVPVSDNYAAQKLTNAADGSVNAPANTLTVGCAGPLLVYMGAIHTYKEQYTADFLKTTHPRTAIGISKDGKTIIQVAVDGRWSKSGWPAEKTAVGMSTAVLAKLMKGLGCYKAMNFDGGGGTAMWVYGQGNARNIVNHVSENQWNWEGTKLRATGCAVYIKSDLKQ